MRADHEVAKRVGLDPPEPDQHARIPDVVVFQIVGVRIVFDQCVAVAEVHHHDERLRLGGFVRRDAREHPAAHLQRRLSPGRGELDVRQRATDGFDLFEAAAPGLLRHDRFYDRQ